MAGRSDKTQAALAPSLIGTTMQASKWAPLSSPSQQPMQNRLHSPTLSPSAKPIPAAVPELPTSSTDGTMAPVFMLHNRPTLPVPLSQPTSSDRASSVYSPQDARSDTQQLFPRNKPFARHANFASPALCKYEAGNMIFSGSKLEKRPSRAIATAPSVVIVPPTQKRVGQVQQPYPTALSLSMTSNLSVKDPYGVTSGTLAKTPERVALTSSIESASVELASGPLNLTTPVASIKTLLETNEVLMPLRPSMGHELPPAGCATSTASRQMAMGFIELETSSADDISKCSQKNNESLGVQQFAAWPKREKRLNPAQSRTVILQNLSSSSTINMIQSMVWGGKVEQIRYEPGKTTALIKFMSGDSCRKFLDATANGIKIPGLDRVIFVDRDPGPNSSNDLLRGLIDVGATRCIRAVNADEDWPENHLLAIARGQSKARAVDRIVQGKDRNGRHYAEFRFGSVYDALLFKVEIQNDEDWEHCNIFDAPDPCEISNGVHIDKH